MNELKIKRPSKLLLWLRRIIAVLFIFWLVSYLLIWWLSPAIIQWQANKFLQTAQLRLSDNSSIRINPFVLQLTLNDVELTGAQSTEVLASVGSAIVDVDAFDLFSNIIRFEQFELAGMTLDARRATNEIKIAGWRLDSQAQQASANGSDFAKEQEAVLENGPVWQVKADLLNLEQFNLNIDNLGESHQLTVRHLQVSSIELSGIEQKLSLQLDLLLDNAPVNLTADFYHSDGQGKITTRLAIEQLNLEKLSYLAKPILTQLSGNFENELNAVVQFEPENISAELSGLDINFDQLKLSTAEVNIALERFSTSLKDLSFSVKGNAQPVIKTKFSMANQRTEVKPAGSKDAIVLFEDYRLNDAILDWRDGPLPDISIANIAFEQLKFSQQMQKGESENKPMISIDKIDANKLNFSEFHLSLESLTLQSLIAAISLDKNKQLIGLVLPGPVTAENNQTPEAVEQQKSTEQEDSTEQAVDAIVAQDSTPQISFSLGQFLLTGDSHFSFNDHSVTPTFNQKIGLQLIEVNSIDSRQPQHTTTFTSQLKTDTYASAQFDGSIQLFSEKMNLQLNALVNEFSLPAISPYLADAMGFEMLNGQFDNKTKLIIKDNIINGESKMTMRGMELSSVDPGKGNTLKDQSAMPLNTALGLLMDDKGNLDLAIPLSGDISQPEFGVSNFVAIVTKKAVMSAAKSYLMETFVPYANVLSVVMVAGEYMLKVSFEDLIYQPTSTTISSDQEAFVSQFITLLKDKPETQVKVCAIATPADLPQHTPALNDPLYQQQLLEVSRLRGESFKAWIVEKGEIQSSRLLLCKPQIDSDSKGRPRIEFDV